MRRTKTDDFHCAHNRRDGRPALGLFALACDRSLMALVVRRRHDSRGTRRRISTRSSSSWPNRSIGGEWPFGPLTCFPDRPRSPIRNRLIFSPPFLTLAAVDPNPSFRAFDAVVLGSLGFGGMFVILMFRDRGWHPVGALVAAIVFAFGGSAAWRIQHVEQVLSLATFPAGLWLLLRALERRSLLHGAFAGLVAGILALGRDQVAYLSLVLLAGVVLAHWIRAESFWRNVRRIPRPAHARCRGRRHRGRRADPAHFAPRRGLQPAGDRLRRGRERLAPSSPSPDRADPEPISEPMVPS